MDDMFFAGGTDIPASHCIAPGPRWMGAIRFENSVIEATGRAAAVLGHKAQGVAWLTHKIAPNGERLLAGTVELAGLFARSTPGGGRQRPPRPRRPGHRGFSLHARPPP